MGGVPNCGVRQPQVETPALPIPSRHLLQAEPQRPHLEDGRVPVSVSWGGHSKAPQTEWLNSRDFVLPGSGGWKPKVKVLAGLVPPQAVERESAPGPSPSFWGLLVILGVPWLVDASPRSLPSSSHLLPVCNLFSSYRHVSLGLGPTHIIQDTQEIFGDILKGPFPKAGHVHRLQRDPLWGLHLTHHVLGLCGLRAGGRKVPEVFPNRLAREEFLGAVRKFPGRRGGWGRTRALRSTS